MSYISRPINVFYGFYSWNKDIVINANFHVFDPRKVGYGGFAMTFREGKSGIDNLFRNDFKIDSQKAINYLTSKKYIFGEMPEDQLKAMTRAALLNDGKFNLHRSRREVLEFIKNTLPKMISELREEIEQAEIDLPCKINLNI